MDNYNQPEAIQELPSTAMHPRTDFTSAEAMESYYLQLVEIMNIRFTEKNPEYTSLKCLQRKLRQFNNVLKLIGTHEWGRGIVTIPGNGLHLFIISF